MLRIYAYRTYHVVFPSVSLGRAYWWVRVSCLQFLHRGGFWLAPWTALALGEYLIEPEARRCEHESNNRCVRTALRHAGRLYRSQHLLYVHLEMPLQLVWRHMEMVF